MGFWEGMNMNNTAHPTFPILANKKEAVEKDVSQASTQCLADRQTSDGLEDIAGISRFGDRGISIASKTDVGLRLKNWVGTTTYCAKTEEDEGQALQGSVNCWGIKAMSSAGASPAKTDNGKSSSYVSDSLLYEATSMLSASSLQLPMNECVERDQLGWEDIMKQCDDDKMDTSFNSLSMTEPYVEPVAEWNAPENLAGASLQHDAQVPGQRLTASETLSSRTWDKALSMYSVIAKSLQVMDTYAGHCTEDFKRLAGYLYADSPEDAEDIRDIEGGLIECILLTGDMQKFVQEMHTSGYELVRPVELSCEKVAKLCKQLDMCFHEFDKQVTQFLEQMKLHATPPVVESMATLNQKQDMKRVMSTVVFSHAQKTGSAFSVFEAVLLQAQLGIWEARALMTLLKDIDANDKRVIGLANTIEELMHIVCAIVSYVTTDKARDACAILKAGQTAWGIWGNQYFK